MSTETAAFTDVLPSSMGGTIKPAKAAKPKAKPAKKAAPKASANGTNDKERAAAKTAGLTLVHYRVLNAIVRSQREINYRRIEQLTGYYSNLTAVCRKDHEGSLGANGFIREHDEEGEPIAFSATAKGKKVFGK